MLEALKAGYPELYARSEYAHLLPKDKLRDLVIEVTGLERENQPGEVDEQTKLGTDLTSNVAQMSGVSACETERAG
jgi:hypothetical protein